MDGKLHSLTDVLKKTLFFFEALSVAELIPHVQKRMLQDYTQTQAEEKILLCLKQHSCFFTDEQGLWHLNLVGIRDNDQFYATLVKKGEPQSLREISKTTASKKKKLKKLVFEEGNLISDGRFIQWNNGYWGLTEWEVEKSHYSLKNLIIRAMKQNPGGLSLNQVFDTVSAWRPTSVKAVAFILTKYPFFEEGVHEIWSYDAKVNVLYDDMVKRYLSALKKQKNRWQIEKERHDKRYQMILHQLEEVTAARREAAAAIAERLEMAGRQDQLLTQMAEKDLLLALRKREILNNRDHIKKLQNRAESILQQCRLWVKRTRDAEEEISKLREAFSKNQSSLETLFQKAQHYKEKEREARTTIAEMKELNGNKIAALHKNEIEIKEKLEKERQSYQSEIKKLHEQLKLANNAIKLALDEEEELKRTLRFNQHEVKRLQDENRNLKSNLRNPLIRIILAVINLFSVRANTG